MKQILFLEYFTLIFWLKIGNAESRKLPFAFMGGTILLRVGA